MLKFLSVKKKYGGHTVLEIPELEIANGLYWLRGANGSGKSTLLKIAGGFLPFEGEVEIDGINLKKQPVDYRKMVSYAEAEPLYPSFISGFDLVNFYLKARKAGKEQADQLIETLGVGSYYKNDVGTYSSGMLKKLSLVLAFIGNTKYIFLDEPLVTIDQTSLGILNNLIADRLASGTNFIFTSHQSMEQSHLPAAKEILVENGTVRFL
ncbi:hypothetical protein WSM22_02330 [Cytophagales bacterium WSM2-2]|nr:hypothetical protein WSM22_02330 [Cytophagales bacterium WSM2-2]